MPSDLFSLPIAAPAFRPPLYRYHHVRRLSVVMQTDPERLRRFVPAPLECVGDRFVVWIEHRVHQDPTPAPAAFPHPFDTYEGSVDVPVRYGGVEGMHTPFMWVPTTEADFARALAGRELQGIGKKMGHFTWDERLLEERIIARLTRNGVNVIDLDVVLDGSTVTLPTRPPSIQVKIVPNIDGVTLDVHQVVALESWNVRVSASRGARVERAELGRSEEDPLYLLQPAAVHGALFTVWSGETLQPCGRVLADLRTASS